MIREGSRAEFEVAVGLRDRADLNLDPRIHEAFMKMRGPEPVAAEVQVEELPKWEDIREAARQARTETKDMTTLKEKVAEALQRASESARSNALALGLAAGVALAGALSSLAPLPAQAQSPTPSVVGPYNVDLGGSPSASQPLITLTSQGPGTKTASISNIDQSGLVCTFKQSAVSGSPSTTFEIDGYDSATATWNPLVVSDAVTTSTTNVYTIWAQPGLVSTDVPTNGVGKSVAVPRWARVSATVTGAGTATTGKIGCNLLK